MSHTIPRELRPYLTEPQAMRTGVPGKTGYLRMDFELDSNGKSILRNLDRRVPIIVQQALYFDEELPDIPCVYILSSGGQNVDGDRYEQNISVGKNAMAFVSTGAATKLAEMRYNHSSMQQVFTLHEGAYLEYLPEPTIPCRHTRFISNTKLIVHPTASLFYSEIFMAGRKYHNQGELFQYDMLSLSTHGLRHDGTHLFYEKMLIEPHKNDIRNIGIMSRYDVLGNAFIVAPPDIAKTIYSLISPNIDAYSNTAIGITTLPNDSGLLVRILGIEAGPVKKLMRHICSITRTCVKGKPLPNEFPWR